MTIQSYVPRRLFAPICIAILLLALAAAFFAGRHMVYQAHPELKEAERAEAVLEKVGELIALPQGETPQMALIEDVESLRPQQPFLVNAENGDILIVYSTSQIAILYRPSTNKLISVGPVTAPVPAAEETPTEPEEAVEAAGEEETDDATTTTDS